MNFSKLVKINGNVHGFEPDTINHRRCAENLKLNDFKNITLNKLGLGNTSGEFRIKVDTPTNRGGNRITDQNDESSELIKVITLDQYVLDKKFLKIDLIKIDVEGFEFNVLKGAGNTISKYCPVLFIELDDVNLKQQNASAKMLVNFLANKGYKIINADDNSSVTENNNFEECHYDIICIPTKKGA
jgi:FkbM family methyltransferase